MLDNYIYKNREVSLRKEMDSLRERNGDLPFELRGGSCGVYNFVDKIIILLCFDQSDRKTCHK